MTISFRAGRRMLTTLALVVLSCAGGATLPSRAHAYTLPVERQGGPRASATFVEDHDGWHAGIDLPRTDGASIVVATTGETVFHAYPLGFNPVHVVMNDNPTVVGPWSMELSDTRQKYMLDILWVRRVTPGKPPIS